MKIKVFISYSHKDNTFRENLVKHLTPLKANYLESWDDTCIEVGSEWSVDIEQNLSSCDAAILLISIDFINSDFIQKKEVPLFLKRREQEGLRIIPILLRECLWKETHLGALQALPKALIPIKNPEDDEVWTEIARQIQKICEELQTRPKQAKAQLEHLKLELERVRTELNKLSVDKTMAEVSEQFEEQESVQRQLDDAKKDLNFSVKKLKRLNAYFLLQKLRLSQNVFKVLMV